MCRRSHGADCKRGGGKEGVKGEVITILTNPKINTLNNPKSVIANPKWKIRIRSECLKPEDVIKIEHFGDQKSEVRL